MKSKKMIAAACLVGGLAFAGLAMAFAPRAVESAEAAAMNTLDASAGNFRLDAVHSSVIFSIKHLGVANFYGRFNRLEGVINWHPDNPAESAITLRIDAASVDTNSERRDAHLRNPDFFNAPEFPHITFTSSKIERAGDVYKVHGELDMHGVKRPLTVDLRQTGSTQHRSGRELIGLESTFTINRSQWNMNYGIDAGALADEVRLIISMEALAAE